MRLVDSAMSALSNMQSGKEPTEKEQMEIMLMVTQALVKTPDKGVVLMTATMSMIAEMSSYPKNEEGARLITKDTSAFLKKAHAQLPAHEHGPDCKHAKSDVNEFSDGMGLTPEQQALLNTVTKVGRA